MQSVNVDTRKEKSLGHQDELSGPPNRLSEFEYVLKSTNTSLTAVLRKKVLHFRRLDLSPNDLHSNVVLSRL